MSSFLQICLTTSELTFIIIVSLEVTDMERTLAFRIDEELHRELKIELVQRGITLKGYVLGLIEKDLHGDETGVDIAVIRAKTRQIQLCTQELADLVGA